MTLFEQLSEFPTHLILVFAIVYFVAGFIDAVVGGGGLLTIPSLLINLPNEPLATLFGTNKIASLSGGTVASYQYSRRIKFDLRLLFSIIIVAFMSSFCGARIVSQIDSSKLKPFMLLIIIIIAIYTFVKKDFGAMPTKDLSLPQQLFFGCIIGILVGFYDGFFGPGTGSFFVLGFVVLLGFDFIHASAYAKVVNCFTNLSALIVFVSQGNYILPLAIIMAICNIFGNFLGAKMAFKKGNGFVRIFFLIVLSLMIIRFGIDIFKTN
ncbi:MAG: hypothetical protein RLZZ312_412 [Bacteroidota bacterium]|jgi:uncharacterized membrane protein YfcA